MAVTDIKNQIEELSTRMDTALNSYSIQAEFGEGDSKINVTLDEYEKSVFLTKAQNEVFINLYNGKNVYGDSFESTEEIRRYLANLIDEKYFTTSTDVARKLSPNSVFYTLPDNVAFITLEQVEYGTTPKDCDEGLTAAVYPVTQDEYARVKDNPFRGPTKYKVIRLDSGEGIVELVSKYTIGDYLLKYLSKPEPIILEDLPKGITIEGLSKVTECKLNSILPIEIYDRFALKIYNFMYDADILLSKFNFKVLEESNCKSLKV